MRKLQFVLVGAIGLLVGHFATRMNDPKASTIVAVGNEGCELNLAGGGGFSFPPRATHTSIRLDCSDRAEFWGQQVQCLCKRAPPRPQQPWSVAPAP